MAPALRSHRRRSIAMLVCLGAAVSLAAQTQQPTFRDRVDVIRLDVAVVDAEQRPVRGLTAGNFTVLEDGVPARVVDVMPVDVPPAALPSTAWLRDVAPDVATNDFDERRLIVILMDDAFSGRNSSTLTGPFLDPWIGKAGKTIARSIVDELGPHDLAAIAFTYMGRRQNFTADRAKLYAAIDSYQPKNGAAGPPLGCAFRGLSGCVLSAFEDIVQTLPESPMRKAIVFVGQGGGMNGLSGESMAGRIGNRGFRNVADAQALFRKLQQANTSVYAFSPGGLQVVSNMWVNDNLRELADNTGGRAVVDTNAPSTGVPAVLDETSVYYLVGVQPARRDGKFHKIKVTVDVPGAEVRTRIGYYTPPAVTPANARPATDVDALDVALTAGFPAKDLTVAAIAAPIALSRSSRASVSIASAVRGAGAVDAEIVAVAFDKDWKTKGTDRKHITLAPQADGFTDVPSRLELAPGRYELRVGAAAGDRVGTVFLDLEIPDFAREPFAVSGVMLTTTALASPIAIADVHPSLRRTFAASDAVNVVWQLYQRGADKVVPATVALTITDDQGRMVSTVEEAIDTARFDGQKTATYATPLRLTALSTGEYLVTMTATAGLRSESANIRIRIQ